MKVITEIQELVNQPFEDVAERSLGLKSEVRVCRMRFATAFNVAFPTVALVDLDFVQTVLSPVVNRIEGSFEETENLLIAAGDIAERQPIDADAITAAANAAMESLNATIIRINEFNTAAAQWLGERNIPKRRRLHGRKRAPEGS
ncbi:hypothetical protein ACFCV3_32530 [Kribbella sp. NPDC056345]|uniref:hypothetical protein n=1 Tax=Kribbella sp. NPDC056345 TaxID=3345789 RepID=UPI0035E17310